MKKLLLLLIGLIATNLSFVAQTIEVGGVVYDINSDHASVTVVTALDQSITTLDIPASITYTFYKGELGEADSRAASDDDLFPIPGNTYTFTVTDIQNRAFSGFSDLKSVNLPENMCSIGYEAFYNCSSLEKIKIPNGVTKLDYVFNNCASLKQVIIPPSVTEITNDFYECGIIDEFIFEDGENALTVNEILNNTKIDYIYQGRTLNGKFYGDCRKLRLGDMVKKIKTNQYEAGTLEEVDLGQGLQIIEGSVFYGCRNLKSISLPESLIEIGWGAFDYCESLQAVKIPSKVTKLEGGFGECKSLKEVIIPGNVVELGVSFSNCVIERLIIEDCDSLLEGAPFHDSQIGEIYQGRNINAFFGKSGVRKVTISDNVTEIGGYSSCPISELSIGKNVTTIRTGAFSLCNELRKVVLPESVTELSQNFNDCESLEYINIPSKVHELEAFCNQCPSLKEIVIPATLEKLSNSFQESNIERFIIEDSEQELDLQSDVSPKTSKYMYVGRNMRNGLGHSGTQLDSLILGNYVTEVLLYSFAHKGIKYLEIGTGVEKIEGYAFIDSNTPLALELIKVHKPEPPLCDEANPAFTDTTYENAWLYVPRSSVGAYKAAPVWKEFKHIYQDSCAVSFVYDENQVSLTLPTDFNGLVAYGETMSFTPTAIESYRLGELKFEGDIDNVEFLSDGGWSISGI